jgi:GR25 family glycosyltransferase involved in LPS biosynthesis
MDYILRSRAITSKFSDSAVLLIAYRRHKNLEDLLQLCLSSGVGRIYVALDAPANSSAQIDVDQCLKIIERFRDQFPDVLKVKVANSNLGCALSVLSACDWALQDEDFLAILEDDCIPSPDFFEYMKDGSLAMKSNSNIFLVSGSQFAPSTLTNQQWHLVHYPLIWGWGTSKQKWQEIKNGLYNIGELSNPAIFSSYLDYTYWRAGTRRALEGFVDAWDTPFAYVVMHLGGQVILPPENLVQNIGNDRAATHTLDGSELLNRPFGNYEPSQVEPLNNYEVDTWLRDSVFNISSRHIFTTRITKLLDVLGYHERIRDPLILRWKSS